jgi:hypothetical protein
LTKNSKNILQRNIHHTLSYSQRACSTFFSDSSLSKNAGNLRPSLANPDLGPFGLHKSRNSLVCFNSPLVVSRQNILLRPFFAPGPRQAHWLSVFQPRTLHSNKSHKICHAKKSPTFGIVKATVWHIFSDLGKNNLRIVNMTSKKQWGKKIVPVSILNTQWINRTFEFVLSSMIKFRNFQ